MEDFLYGTLGVLILASWIYIFAAQFQTIYKDRTRLGKFATFFGMACFVLFIIGTISKYYTIDKYLPSACKSNHRSIIFKESKF